MVLRAAYALIGLIGLTAGLAALQTSRSAALTLPTGKTISPAGAQTPVGSFPANLLLSKSGKYLIVTNTGFRENLSVLNVATGKLVFQKPFLASSLGSPNALYFGLAIKAEGDGTETLAVSHGTRDSVSLYSLAKDGTLSLIKTIILPKVPNPLRIPLCAAGLAWSPDGQNLYVVANESHAFNQFRGSVYRLDAVTGKAKGSVTVGAFPLSIVTNPDGSLIVGNEGGRAVTWVDPTFSITKSIPTGEQPAYLSASQNGGKIFVSNANSDTVSEVDAVRGVVDKTILIRPGSLGGYPGMTPLGSAASSDGKRLYVAIADLNAVAVLDLPSSKVVGYIPAGWYPTSVALSPDDQTLFVANAKGVQPRNPNNVKVGQWGQYGLNIIEGTVAKLSLSEVNANLPALTTIVKQDNHQFAPEKGAVANPGIRHIFYIIKENRTYDQILGDDQRGNGDASITLFGAAITPNEHALADRFGLFDNFYVNAEVSADGWNWSTSGQANEYVERNVPNNYSGRGETTIQRVLSMGVRLIWKVCVTWAPQRAATCGIPYWPTTEPSETTECF